MTPGTTIRKFCLECVGNPKSKCEDVKSCTGVILPRKTICPLHKYRLGSGRPSVKTIRKECLYCMGGKSTFVEECKSEKCNLWIYRLGKNPNWGIRNPELCKRLSKHPS